MKNDLPDHLKQSLSETDYLVVFQWWNSLSPEERQELSDISHFPEADHVALPDHEQNNYAPEAQPFYEYLVNHELRCVGYFDDTAAARSYKIVSHYLATLGSEMRHRRGTVG